MKANNPVADEATGIWPTHYWHRNDAHYAYTGNVQQIAGGSTCCSHCASRLIARDCHVISRWKLDSNGHGRSCGKSLPGVFESDRGTWGAKSVPVDLQSLSA